MLMLTDGGMYEEANAGAVTVYGNVTVVRK
jgi:hypothetical protein